MASPPCNAELPPTDAKTEAKFFFLDQSNLLFTGALSFLASFAVNSFVQALFKLSLPVQQESSWQALVYNAIYVLVVVGLALAIMYPLARAKSKRDKAAKDQERLIPTLVKVCSPPETSG
jgi:hypothetical protein